MGWDHVEEVQKHESQKDYKTGFGGQFGVQSDRVDKSAVGWEHVESTEKHTSQKGKDQHQLWLWLHCPCVRSDRKSVLDRGFQCQRRDGTVLYWDYFELSIFL